MSTQFETVGATGSRSREGVVQWVVPYFVGSLTEINNLPAGYEGCTRVSSTWVSNNDGTGSAIATITYEGADVTSQAGDSYNKPSWSIDFDLTELPIESHWNFEAIKTKYGGGYDPNDPVKWIFPEKMPSGQSGTGLSTNSAQGKSNPMYGVRTYIVMYTRVSKSYSRTTSPSDVTSKIGKQSVSIPGAPAALGGLAKGDKSWLQLPPQVSKRGGVWEITESWKLSEHYEWQDQVYNKFNS
jgi:hypothetical protein